MSLTKKILSLAVLIGAAGLAEGSTAQAATKKDKFAAFLALPTTLSAQSTATMVTAPTTPAAAFAAQRSSLRAARGVTAAATPTSLNPFQLRQFIILQRQYLRLINLLNRAELSQERSLMRQLIAGLITPTQFSTSLQGVIALYQLAKDNATANFLQAATNFQ
ncbi:hypothetical protein [Singulisphaera sp. PoT]|uniref:hypothetical protein n=1 Tax=Singulisphaera sp. PoT TaxID=3411797 RepID=UPI003BF6033A